MVFLFAVMFLVPALLVAFGWLFTHGRYPAHPNGVYGYRTSRSMKNDETWRFAQERWGRLSWRTGWVLLGSSALVAIALLASSVRRYELYVGAWIVLQAVLTIVTVLPVERALRRRFDEAGRRRASCV